MYLILEPINKDRYYTAIKLEDCIHQGPVLKRLYTMLTLRASDWVVISITEEDQPIRNLKLNLSLSKV